MTLDARTVGRGLLLVCCIVMGIGGVLGAVFKGKNVGHAALIVLLEKSAAPLVPGAAAVEPAFAAARSLIWLGYDASFRRRRSL